MPCDADSSAESREELLVEHVVDWGWYRSEYSRACAYYLVAYTYILAQLVLHTPLRRRP